jgi:MFS family permease
MQTSTFRKVFKAFQYRDFRLMWIGACMSSIGTWMQIVAQGWLIYRLSHSPRLLGLDQFLGGLPIFLFTLIGGVVADRMERRKILLVSQYIQMASAAWCRSGRFCACRLSLGLRRPLADRLIPR